MAFENISKVEFISSGKSVVLHNAVIIETSSNKQAKFIAYCFNLQQRYDISKLEEAVNILERLLKYELTNEYYIRQIAQLLKQTKK